MKAKIWNNKFWIKETRPNILKQKYTKLLKESNFKILRFKQHYFKPQGWTGIFIIAESHLAIHTFPEESKTYIELSSCNKEKQKTFMKILKAEKQLN
jgi:S-adenosylmethionine decarboxylase